MFDYYMEAREPDWIDTFKLSLYLSPTIDEHDVVDDVTCYEAFVHFLCLPWRFACCVVPPKHYGDGWPAFIASFILIGIVSYFVFETAVTLGCVLNLRDSFLSLTLIALGSSLPDCAVSYHAAKRLSTADAALSNIYGANAANIFIGLGLPWTIACFYYWAKTGEATYTLGHFEAADITFAVVLFLLISIIVFMTLFVRRYSGNKGELGGTDVSKYLTGFCFMMMWVVFVVLNTANSYELLGERDVFIPLVNST